MSNRQLLWKTNLKVYPSWDCGSTVKALQFNYWQMQVFLMSVKVLGEQITQKSIQTNGMTDTFTGFSGSTNYIAVREK